MLKKKCFFKKTVSLLIIISIILMMFFTTGISVFATNNVNENTQTTTTQNSSEEPEQEYIYYSDLFYGYSTYLNNSPYLINYSIETQRIFGDVYSDYMDSPNFAWTNIKHSLPLVFDLKEYAKLITDLTGLTTFTYEKALDKANQEFAKELLGDSELAKTYGAEAKWVKNLNKFLKVYDEFEKNFDVTEKTEIQIYEETFQYFIDNSAFSSITITNIEIVKQDILPNISKITKILSTGADALKGAQTLMMSLMIEDIRSCIIDEVVASQNKDTMLYDGMSRLKKQLKNGFSSYFYYNYIEQELIGDVEKYVVKKLVDGTIFADGGYKLIGAIVDVACWVVFDVIFDVPDIDDLTTQAVLSQYSNDFYYLLRSKTDTFKTQFKNEDISTYETLFSAFLAATNAAFKATEKITLSSNRESFNSVKNKYIDSDIYTNYVENVKELIRVIPTGNRIITDFGDWEVDEDTKIKNGQDVIEENTIYEVNDKINANIFTKNIKLYIETSIFISKLSIGGTVDVNSPTTNIYTNYLNFLDNCGYLESKSYYWSKGNIYVNGSAEFKGDQSDGQRIKLYLSGGNIYVSVNLLVGEYFDINIDNDSVLNVAGNIDVKAGGGSAFRHGSCSIIIGNGNIYCGQNLTLIKGSGGYGGTAPTATLSLTSSLSNAQIKGNMIVDGNKSLIFRDGKLSILGNAIFSSIESISFEKGKVVLCGDSKQKIKNMPFHDVLVVNPEGIQLDSDLYLYGTLEMQNSEIYQEGYPIILFENANLIGSNEFDDVVIEERYSLPFDMVCESLLTNASLTIPEGKSLFVSDDLNISYMTDLKNYGNLEVGGSLNINYEDSYGWLSSGATNFYNYGTAKIDGNIIGYNRGYVHMDNNADLYIRGDINLRNGDGRYTEQGTLIICGDSNQMINNFSNSTIIIKNHNNSNITFASYISPSELFLHNGNNFTLYNNGQGSTFVDYDGDGVLDHLDPHPTMYNVDHDYEIMVVEPTPTKKGYTSYSCTICDRAYKDNYIAPTGDRVQNMQILATDKDITVTWDAIEGTTKYNLYVNDAEGNNLITRALAADRTSVTLSWPSELEWDKTYSIGIRARTTKWLDTVYKTAALTVADRIVDVKTQSVGRTIKVDWRAYEGATQYYVYVYEKGAYPTTVTSVRATTNSATIINAINPEVDYEVRVIATKGVAKMATADALSIDARLNVFTPDTFTERGITPTKVGIGFDEVRGADKYWVYLNPANGGEEIIKESTRAIAAVGSLAPNTEYTVQIQARIVDADGKAHYSGKSAVLGTIKTSDWEDIGFTATEASGGAELSWSAPTNAYGYIIYRSVDGGKTYKKLATISDAAQTGYIDSSAKNGYMYGIIYQVQDDFVTAKTSLIKAQ